jgi:hypothetical protein
MRIVVALMLALLLVGSLQAADQRRHPSFDELDHNSDGRVSMVEASASPQLNPAFAGVDRDHDDYVSEQEFQAWMDTEPDASPQPLLAPGEVGDDGRIEPPRIQRW